jgi:hypothetical protein
MESPTQIQASKNWWNNKRFYYNKWLIISGFIAYIILFIIEGHKNFTLFALIFQIIASCVFIGIANLFYSLGHVVDKEFNKKNNPIFRENIFKLGFSFSILLPFIIPLLFIFFPAWDSGYEPVKKTPSEKELIGIYELNNSSKVFLRNQGYNIDSSRLELNANKEYYFHKLPDNVLDGFGRSNQKTIDQRGEWRAYKYLNESCEILIGGAGYELTKKDNHFAILITIGDPDSREGIVYEKKVDN